MPDPLDALRLPLTPLAPRRQFAVELRRRIEAELRGPQPEGEADMPTATVHATITPYLIVDGAADALTWYAENLGARETYRLEMPDGRIGHASMQIGESEFHLADEYPEMGIVGPGDRRSPVSFTVQVADVDAAFDRVVAAGATVEREVRDEFYGARAGSFRDPFGHSWTVSKHIRDVPDDEIQASVRDDNVT
jgi:PhnB protein